MKIFRHLGVPDLFTFGNCASGVISILFSIRQDFTIAAIFILIAVLMDFLDGKVARFFSRTHDFGKELDSLADAVSFGVAPAVFGFIFLESSSANWILSYIAFVFLVLCGIARLARFNVTKIDGYEGMPITMNGIIVPIIYFASVPAAAYPYAYIVSGFLMISAIRIKKII